MKAGKHPLPLHRTDPTLKWTAHLAGYKDHCNQKADQQSLDRAADFHKQTKSFNSITSVAVMPLFLKFKAAVPCASSMACIRVAVISLCNILFLCGALGSEFKRFNSFGVDDCAAFIDLLHGQLPHFFDDGALVVVGPFRLEGELRFCGQPRCS